MAYYMYVCVLSWFVCLHVYLLPLSIFVADYHTFFYNSIVLLSGVQWFYCIPVFVNARKCLAWTGIIYIYICYYILYCPLI